MKKQILLFILMLLPMIASADAVEINGIYYNLIEKAKVVEVTVNPNNYSGKIVIPETIVYQDETYKVTKIGKNAFYACSELTSIDLPNTITEIDDESFQACTSLSEVIIPYGVKSIGKWAFTGCVGLKSVSIPNSVTEIRTCGFSNCSNLSSVIIPNSITTLQSLVFSGCSSLQTVDIPESVISISGGAFYKCTGLTSVSLPNSLTTIGEEVFQGCVNLTTITIPNSVTSIGYNAFANCDKLFSVTIGSNVVYIRSKAFGQCPKLTEVHCYAPKVPTTNSDAFKDSYVENCTLYVPLSSLQEYNEVSPWKEFGEIKAIAEESNFYKLIYKIDGEIYKTYEIEKGKSITPEAAPTKEGYTFSGWSDIPQTMPNHDVTVTGSFTVNKYKLTYSVDGVEYKTYDIEYGTTITPEPAPTKEGYTFSGWSNIPTTMPANDVTVTGTFTVNKYKLIYKVDGVEYKTYDIEYGATITPEAAPTKEGYTFSGWNDLPQTMPAKDVTVNGTFTINKYKLTYMVDGSEYKSYDIEYGASITLEVAPTKEGYTFSGWSDIPTTMPAQDVTVTGTFTVNKYTLTYMVDGDAYKTYEIEYGARITPEAEPTKEGYTFSGWSEIPQTMPAHDVTVTGTFTKGAYKLIYMVDGEVYKTVNYDYGETITPEAEPTKEGYTFSGWSNIPTTMPANDVTVTGTFTVNKYKLTYMVDGEVYKSYDIEYGATINPEAEPTKDGYKFSGWSYIPNKMPAEDVTVVGTFTQEAFVKDNVTYEINGNEASVTHADNAKGEIVIEEFVVINGKSYNVTSIADGAFQGCTELTSIEIPATVTSIGENAFNGCSSLIIIKIGKDIKEIGSKAFANIGKSNARTRAEEIMLKVYCEAEVLPSTAGDAFENSPIAKGILYVNDDLVGVYKVVMPWNGFGTIVGLSTGIRSISIDSEDAWIFDMQGNRIDNVRKGVNIIRTRDGKTKKIVVK